MKAFILQEAGSVDKLMTSEVETPIIKSDEVLVKVVAISINPVDVKARANEGILDWIFGKNRPVILGWDISGIVSETGINVKNFKPGDEVFGMVNFFGNGKAYAEYVASPATHLTLKPGNVTHQQAVATSMVASTAYQALVDVAQVRKGDNVLIHGASGGVGHLAVQIAKHLGAYVIATSSAKNKEFLLNMGADKHIDYTQEKIEEVVKDVDIILDTVGGETLMNSIHSIKDSGVIVTLPSPEIPQELLEEASKKGVKLIFYMVESRKDTMDAIASLLKKGVVKPHIYKTFSFEEIREAHLEVETNRVVGKVVVTI
ncbi:NADP-dependent oxidoreductase [Siphonobacter sp. SORGH_AS_0500]|uniref:NADP-dependent oxidoreductase n=1 Tax=Siphonobacter sp. SORGH_AS_0500 TaxID=1864824 RepID=UPI002857823F|nr:NADP-dependent oxidoreductase [Siphonobacter sp. SORGH_AS_0500]MDR6193275.1 NADPH:quinone reductase-like Zn-dependent oxidoreductase [Siphonobacter sp. SORGH_AS_0500]